jgi:hypothetical protein
MGFAFFWNEQEELSIYAEISRKMTARAPKPRQIFPRDGAPSGRLHAHAKISDKPKVEERLF